MIYKKIVKGKFIERPNRFIALVEVDSKIEKVHVKNTGRCKELLFYGATVYLEDFYGRMGSRKMRYSLIAVDKPTNFGTIIINMDSQAPNRVIEDALLNNSLLLPNMNKIEYIKREKTYGASRFDFFIRDEQGNEAFIEVKGVTLENDGIFQFPDAPTKRGVKHIKELISLVETKKYKAYIIFLVQMNLDGTFKPNWLTHREFALTLKEAQNKGVCILVYNSLVQPNSIVIKGQLNFSFNE